MVSLARQKCIGKKLLGQKGLRKMVVVLGGTYHKVETPPSSCICGVVVPQLHEEGGGSPCFVGGFFFA